MASAISQALLGGWCLIRVGCYLSIPCSLVGIGPPAGLLSGTIPSIRARSRGRLAPETAVLLSVAFEPNREHVLVSE